MNSHYHSLTRTHSNHTYWIRPLVLLAATTVSLLFYTQVQAQSITCYPDHPEIISVIPATNGNDPKLWGSNNADRMCGLLGNDVMYGNMGNDFIQGNQGMDTIYAGHGADFVQGGQDNDVINGDYDDDKLFGDRGKDTLNGNWGDDLVSGGDDIDTVRGGNGHDSIYGDAGGDYLYGDAYNDDLWGGTGADKFYYNGKQDGVDIIHDFEPGVDRLFITNFQKIIRARDGNNCVITVYNFGVVYGSINIQNMAAYCDVIGAATAESTPPTLALSTESGTPGTLFSLSGSGFTPYETVSLALNDNPLTTIQADATGTFTLSVDTQGWQADSYLITAPSYTQSETGDFAITLQPVAATLTLENLDTTDPEQQPADETEAAFTNFIYLPVIEQ